MQILPIATNLNAADGLRVLVAEDGLVHRCFIHGLLRRCGYCVTMVENGREVLAALQNHSYDVVLMDVEMPEMDGLSTTRAIRNLEARTGSRIPIIALTDRDNRTECLNAGMEEHLRKPVSMPNLRKSLEAVVGTRGGF